MTPQQLTTLRAAILAETDPAFVIARTDGNNEFMLAFLNSPSTFVVSVKAVPTGLIGRVINYIAFAAMTTANRGTLTAFLQLNPSTFDGSKPDIREMLTADSAAGIFSGSLGGQGAATRAALSAILVRFAKRAERLYATGTGTSLAPGDLVFEGDLTSADLVAALQPQ